MTLADDKSHRFTRAEYNRLAEIGVFDDQRVELLEGQILDMSPQNRPHFLAVSLISRFLNKQLSEERYLILCQAPVDAGEVSEPEPDFAIFEVANGVAPDPLPGALMVIEVSDTTLARDRRKAAIYAAAGVREYWIVNLTARVIEQYTMPTAALADGSPARFAAVRKFSADEEIACAVLPLPAKLVSELLPVV